MEARFKDNKRGCDSLMKQFPEIWSAWVFLLLADAHQ